MENKKRLIYADDIVDVAEHAYDEWNLAMAAADGKREINHVYKMQELCKAVKAVAENAPTVDAVEVVHGHWIVDRERMSAECSECGKGLNFSDEMQIDLLERMERYCYYCGAKMDGERK